MYILPTELGWRNIVVMSRLENIVVVMSVKLYSIEFGELKFGQFAILNIVYMAQSCCNPFGISGHYCSSRRKNLRPVTAWMCETASHITMGIKICDTCRKKLSKESPDVTESVTSELDPPTPSSSQATKSDPLFSHDIFTQCVSSRNRCDTLFSE